MKISNTFFLVLDIETSTLFENNEPISVWLSYGYIKMYTVKGKSIDKFYFREWEELKSYLNYINRKFSKSKIVCFVHNLSYEFDFLIKNISKATKILANKSHKVILSELEQFKSIQFRCSYLLSGYSLRKIGDLVGLKKLESEYRTIYPRDEVTQEEKEYCERDCDIVAKYIVDVMLKEYGILTNIPYTKTGRVRKILNNYYQDESNRKWDLMPPENCYQAMLDAFNGGICISNPIFTGLHIKNVRSFDEKSAYPFAMLSEEYPYCIEKLENFSENNLSEKFWIAKIKFYNINSKYPWNWLSKSKMNDYSKFESSFFNGKLINADYIVRTITNIDYDIICKTYDFEKIEILEFYRMKEYGKLPPCYIKTIEHFAVKKETIKEKMKTDNSIDLQIDYMLSKNDFNSIFGMSVQKLQQEEFYIDNEFNWCKKETKYKQIKSKHMKRNFLFGIYITAYARKNLIYAIIENCPYTFIYADTDSIKCILEKDFVDTNKVLEEYKDNKYIRNLGRFIEEEKYTDFMTFGAKKYCYSYDNEKSVIMTVAGLPKTVEPLSKIEDFKIGKTFENCKLATKYTVGNKYYSYDEDFCKVSDGEKDLEEFYRKNNIKTNGGVMLYSTSYKLSITYNDIEHINFCRRFFEKWEEKILQQNGIVVREYCPIIAEQI